ncbi:T9SS type A sorting domain-containing protein [Marinoscillum sp. MHG1-6]|uniref:T9SS type A sorting domain-containing protein n=1 Tax=Marinoscillum sp. MHG1-6 TaxID=2959627 RepID=UPI0021573D7B|nr:T9SS type A sorting domain-containing protein [Marinoscillum sp. MHG1-6]
MKMFGMRLLMCGIVLFAAFMVRGQSNPYKAPLYWSVYEYHIEKEMAGEVSNYIPESVWLENIDWVDENLKDLGYDMICIDGWGDVGQLNANGYRKSHSSNWEHDYAWWSDHLQSRGMTLGMYGNPLWINVPDNDQTRKVVGTEILVSSLKDPNEDALWFDWVQVDHPGAEEYVKGYIKYYADMGVKYFRIDFLSWFESGWDRYIGTVGPDRRTDGYYETALQWMREEADAQGMFLSLVMPNLYDEAADEKVYGHMFRINEDTGEGGWWKFSDKDRGQKRTGWSVYGNPFDGLTYWSYLAGRGNVILDPDFIRINTFANNEEKKSVISVCLMAGGPITISDQYNTIGDDLWLYQNKELLELNWDGFVGKPLSNDPTNPQSQIWKGQLSNGEWIVALFNREGSVLNRSIDFNSELGISGNAQIRDLWSHEDLPVGTSFSTDIPAHGCRVIKVVAEGVSMNKTNGLLVESVIVDSQADTDTTNFGVANILVVDTEGNPVEGATLTATLSGSFEEQLTGVSGADGIVTLVSSTSKLGKVKVNLCLDELSHSELIYSPELGGITCFGDNLYVAGTYNDWSLTRMQYENGWWKMAAVPMKAGAHQLKFANTSDWSGEDWGNASGLSGVAKITTGGDPDINFTIDQSALYQIYFNEETLQFSIEKSEQLKVHEQMYMSGSFTLWNPREMTFDGTEWVLEDVGLGIGNYELRFTNSTLQGADRWGNASGKTGTATLMSSEDPNVTFTTTAQGKYTIAFNDITLDYRIEIPNGVLSLGQSFSDEIVKVYPNPTSDHIQISLPPSCSLLGISILSLDGKRVASIYPKAHQRKIDLKSYGLQKGIYLLQVRTNKEVITERIVISK